MLNKLLITALVFTFFTPTFSYNVESYCKQVADSVGCSYQNKNPVAAGEKIKSQHREYECPG